MYGIRFEYSTPTRFVVFKELRNLSFQKQMRIEKAWRKAQGILNTKYFGVNGFYVSAFYHGSN